MCIYICGIYPCYQYIPIHTSPVYLRKTTKTHETKHNRLMSDKYMNYLCVNTSNEIMIATCAYTVMLHIQAHKYSPVVLFVHNTIIWLMLDSRVAGSSVFGTTMVVVLFVLEQNAQLHISAPPMSVIRYLWGQYLNV